MESNSQKYSIATLKVNRPGESHYQIVGVDVGGTKTEIKIFKDSFEKLHVILPTRSWRSDSDTVKKNDINALIKLVSSLTNAENDKPFLCIGLHSADTNEQLHLAQDLVNTAFPDRSIVVNDAELLGPAAGETDALSLVVGTGMIIVARSVTGELLRSDGYGYGWMFSEFGSAPALARESVRFLVQHAITFGEESSFKDPLGKAFAKALGASNMSELCIAFGSNSSDIRWGRYAPLVFQALNEGSNIANKIIDNAVDHIYKSIASVYDRGAMGHIVVGAGGVITHQPEFSNRLKVRFSDNYINNPLILKILDEPPVNGAIRLASNLAAKDIIQHPYLGQ